MVADGDCGGFFSVAPACDAALDVLGDWGSDGDWLTHLPTPPASPLVCSDVTKDSFDERKPPKNTRSHYRRKRESRDAKRTALQQQIQQLTRALDDEKKRFPAREQPLTGDALALSREWSRTATRQRRQRHAAEHENKALRDLRDTQVKTAHQIDRLLQKALRIASCLERPTSETVTIRDYSGPTLGVPVLLAYLDGLFAQAHCVPASGVFAQREGREFREVCVRDVGESGLQVDFVASFLLPFSAARVADAIWTETSRMEHVGYEHAFLNSKILVSSFISAPDTPSSNHGHAIAGITHGQTALRRFDAAADGSVWLLAMNHARILGEDGETSGFMRGDGWVRVEPIRPATQTVCRVKFYHRVTGRPRGHERASRDGRARWAHAAVTKVTQRQWDENFQTALQAIENDLVTSNVSQ